MKNRGFIQIILAGCIALAYIQPSLAEGKIIEGHGINMQSRAVTEEVIPYIKDLGFDYVRVGVGWRDVEKTRGRYSWKEYDSLVRLLQSNGLKPFFILFYNNHIYGAKYHRSGINTDEQRKAFVKYARAVVSRYKSKGIIWEIWNEPNCGPFWKPAPDFYDYSDMANAVIKGIREVAPGEIIIGPAITRPNSREFLQAMGEKGVFEGLDAVSFHFYPTYPNGPESIDIPHICDLISTTVKNYTTEHKKLPIISSEAGFSLGSAGMTELKQARFLSRQIILNKANGIKISIWHALRDSPNPKSFEGGFGLLRNDLTPKPAYFAVKATIKALKGKYFVKEWKMKKWNDFGYEFSDGKHNVLFAWTRNPPHSVNINGSTVELKNIPRIVPLW